MRFGALLGSKGIASRAGMLRIFAVLVVVGASFGIWRASTQAVGETKASVDPPNRNLVWYNRTPFTQDIKITTGTTPIAAYQFTLRWDPAVLRWVSTALPVTWLQMNGRVGFCTQNTSEATNTPQIPQTPTPTYTPANPTATPTRTPTPAGFLAIGCGSFGNATPGAPAGATGTGTVANIQLKSIATAPGSAPLSMSEFKATNTLATEVVPLTTANGAIKLVNCYDMDGDGVISILDISRVAAHFGATINTPVPPAWIWDPIFDPDADQVISILDISAVAAAFGQPCPGAPPP